MTATEEGIPSEIQAAFGVDGARVEHVPSLINRTYIVRDAQREPRDLVLQRLHPVFGARVNEDISAITEQLSAKGLLTPRLVPSLSGALWVEDESGRPWRALSLVEGVTFHRARSPEQLRSAAELLGRFHAALDGTPHVFVHHRPLHESARHFALLGEALRSPRARGDAEAQELGAEILQRAERARVDFSALPRRVCHGDPKISNVLFDPADPDRALCWIDLDTVGHGYLAYELGDALRSWCNPAGEDVAQVEVELALFSATLEGYLRGPFRVGFEELSSAVDGLATVSLELASRFARDVIEDSYWGWDPARFPSRREHNLVRARGQLALSASVERQRSLLLERMRGLEVARAT